MKARIIKSGTVNGRTYRAPLTYVVTQTQFKALLYADMVLPQGEALIAVAPEEVLPPVAPKRTRKKAEAATTAEPFTTPGSLTQEEAPKPKRAKKETKEEKFDEDRS